MFVAYLASTQPHKTKEQRIKIKKKNLIGVNNSYRTTIANAIRKPIQFMQQPCRPKQRRKAIFFHKFTIEIGHKFIARRNNKTPSLLQAQYWFCLYFIKFRYENNVSFGEKHNVCFDAFTVNVLSLSSHSRIATLSLRILLIPSNPFRSNQNLQNE